MSSDKKVWTWQGSLQDHVRFLVHLPFFFIAPVVLKPKAAESVHLSVNSVNRCPFCTGLHCEIGRLAGLEDAKALNQCGKLTDEEDSEYGIFSKYGACFGKNNGRGEELDKIFDDIVNEHGMMAAKSAQGLAFFLTWGSLGGNTLISFFRGTLRGNMREGSNLIFEIVFAAYYSLVFAIITATSKILTFFPANVHPAVNVIIGLVLPTVASMWIIPYSLVGLLCTPFILKEQFDPLGGQYEVVV
jgi:AhpD family alkylhydroperoxidase